MTKHTPLDIATLRRDAKAGYESPDPDVSILARDCFVLLARLEQAQGERDALRQQLAAVREALFEVRYEDFYGDCIYCQQKAERDGHDPECRYLALAAAQETPHG